jgi:predicted NAD-dependent protein-ADP-ribosyltransferase YbiA (DUF1768 family)
MNYPKHWWEDPQDPTDKPDWELLPSEAGPGEVILSKRNELGILSNLAPTPFELDGQTYASIEALWQMLKLPEDSKDDPRNKWVWPCSREQMQRLSGLESKRLGDQASLVMKSQALNWVSYQGERWTYPETNRGPFYGLIRRALQAKLVQNPEVFQILKQTGDLILKPDHTTTGPLSPAHRYNEIWMELRQTLPV